MSRFSRLAAWSTIVLVAAGCTDERVVFRDRDLLANVPSGAAGYLGYSNEATKLTVCGNCHVGQQVDWVTTAHAGAWETLENSGHSQEFCEGCHTVNEMGNNQEAEGGWLAIEDTRYYDVQCESCHGPGLTHVQNPGATIPLASLGVTVDGTNGCGECHSGAHHPFVEEWAQSGHGQVIASPASREACQGCHTGQAALAAFGADDAEYEEKGSATPLPIACGVCHDPHGSGNAGQLRYSISVPDEEQNLCMRCHHKRGGPDPASAQRGPHSPEGPLLLGEAGWWPPNLQIEPGNEIIGTHGSEANPRMCAGCHVYTFEVTDNLTGEFLVNSVGHLFQATPCLDAQGVPTGDDTCPKSERSYASCTQSGCHGTQQAARSAHVTAELRLTSLANQLLAMVAQIPATELDPNDGRYTTAEGARFNAQLGLFNGTEVHNPFLAEALLIASIQQVQTQYGISPSAGVSLQAQLKAPAGGHP